MKLNKYVAHCGICSRRKAAELVKAGKIIVNGTVEINPAIEIGAEDIVEYQGKQIKIEEKKVYVLLNKPKNTITSLSDERDRRTVIDVLMGKVKERVFPVGRLDYGTTGLLLLTNDGDLAQSLAHPSYKVKKIYQVELDKEISEAELKQIKKGLTLEDGFAEVDAVNFIKDKPKNHVGIELHIGKNRIVRRIFAHLGYEVIKLDRVYYAGLTKKDLPRGWHRHLEAKEVIMLKHFT